MARKLYTSWFSTFARKAAIGLELKELSYDAVDALTREFRPKLRQINPRTEVPVLIDGDTTIVNSSDILQYLDWRYPNICLYPVDVKERVAARALERLADQRFDAIVVDCSFWHWADRDDAPPDGLISAGQIALDEIFGQLESALESRPKPWPFGQPGVVECAWFPNLVAVKPLGFTLESSRYPAITAWLKAMREHPVFANDCTRTARFLKTLSSSNHERKKLFWNGDRLEWLFSAGFGNWFFQEIQAGRVALPFQE